LWKEVGDQPLASVQNRDTTSNQDRPRDVLPLPSGPNLPEMLFGSNQHFQESDLLEMLSIQQPQGSSEFVLILGKRKSDSMLVLGNQKRVLLNTQPSNIRNVHGNGNDENERLPPVNLSQGSLEPSTKMEILQEGDKQEGDNKEKR